MFNAGSILHRLNKANFRLLIVLSAVRDVTFVYLSPNSYLVAGANERRLYSQATLKDTLTSKKSHSAFQPTHPK